jgi:transposase
MTKKYTAEFKESAVKLANESGLPVAQTARNLGINENTLHSWIHNARMTKNEEKTDNLPHLDEVKRLKKENLRLTEERDLLKKAAAYFASQIR